MLRYFNILLLLGLSGLVLGGCDADGDTDADADGDMDTDADGDMDTDADGDTDADADGDTDADADGDTDPDAGGDAGADALGDAGADTGADSAADGDADSGGDAGADADADGACAPSCEGGACSTGEWVTICAGTFTMGSPEGELGREPGAARETQHEATLTGDFEILSTEVTQAEFLSLMEYAPSSHGACGDDCPVESISWPEAAAYCNALSDAAGLGRCYDCSGSGVDVTCEAAAAHASPYECPGYRLPTEAEWEYAARAGTTTGTYNGEPDASACEASAVLDTIAWHCGNSSDTTHEVGLLDPNPWGLYDMLGNVYEWCHDWNVTDLGSGDATDPFGPETGTDRLIRGGSYRYDAKYTRAGFRYENTTTFRTLNLGFRPARSLP